MPQRKNAVKALRINQKRRLHNLSIKIDLKKTLKKFKSLVAAQNTKEAQTFLPTLYKKIDKAAKRNILGTNTASRRKSMFTRLLAKASTKKSS